MNYSGEPYNAYDRRKGQQLFYIMGGNKVAPPKSGGNNKYKPGGGKPYTGKAAAGSSGYGAPPK